MRGNSIVAGVNLAFNYAAGETASRFLIALRDERRIYGRRCPDCGRVLVPARSFCPRCGVETADWVEVGPAGTLTAFTVVHQPEPYHPLPAPFAYGLIRLDGADVELVHLLGETPVDSIKVGMRVEAVFAAERMGSICDIAYFRPAT
ncbi:MAG: Zn-ribbon domain-containing OB-fold protein [Anaerolineae bacterium]